MDDIRILMTFVAGKNDELGLKADSHLSQISAILPLVRKADIMCKKFTPDELNKMDHKTKDDVIYRKGQILRSTPNTAPLICGACNTQPEGLSTMA